MPLLRIDWTSSRAQGFALIEGALVVTILAWLMVATVRIADLARMRMELLGLAHQVLLLPGSGDSRDMERRLSGLLRAQYELVGDPLCHSDGELAVCETQDPHRKLERNEGMLQQDIRVHGSMDGSRWVIVEAVRYGIWP